MDSLPFKLKLCYNAIIFNLCFIQRDNVTWSSPGLFVQNKHLNNMILACFNQNCSFREQALYLKKKKGIILFQRFSVDMGSDQILDTSAWLCLHKLGIRNCKKQISKDLDI